MKLAALLFTTLSVLMGPLAWSGPIPSSIGISVGGDDAENKNGQIYGEYITPWLWSVNGFAQQTKVGETDESESYNQKTVGLGLASSPLKDWVFAGDVSASTAGEDVTSTGIRGSVKYQWERWSLGVSVGGERMEFTGLPPLIFGSDSEIVTANNYSLFGEFYASEKVILYASWMYQEYDKDPDEYTTGLRVLVIPETVQTAASGFFTSEARLGVSYASGRWALSFDMIHQKMIVADQRVQTLQWTPSYQIHKNWSTALAVARSTYKQVDNNETLEETGSSGTLSITYLFD